VEVTGVGILAEVASSTPDALNDLLPPWAQGLSLVSILTLIILAFLRDWVIPSKRNEREVAAERRVSETWENNFHQATANNDKLIAALEPVLKSNEAILKAVSEVQDEQRRTRERGRPR
jgi:hypothetical protein